MNISSLNPGLFGIQSGMAGVQQAAEDVAAVRGNHSQLVEAMVNLKAQANLVQASSSLVKSTNEALGSVLDILA